MSKINIPNTQNMICQTQIDGKLNNQVVESFGFPKISLPIKIPGPIEKKVHIYVTPRPVE